MLFAKCKKVIRPQNLNYHQDKKWIEVCLRSHKAFTAPVLIAARPIGNIVTKDAFDYGKHQHRECGDHRARQNERQEAFKVRIHGVWEKNEENQGQNGEATRHCTSVARISGHLLGVRACTIPNAHCCAAEADDAEKSRKKKRPAFL